MDALLLLGIAAACGLFGGEFLRRLRVPQVVGYILMGVLLGESFVGVIKLGVVDRLAPINSFALALIGFTIGGELKFDVLSGLKKSIVSILLLEAFGSFLLVTFGVYLLTGKLYVALIFGALSSATAPAATVDVLWEYKAKGILTSTLLAIVGLDDAVALIIYGFAASFAKMLMSGNAISVLNMIGKPVFEIVAAIGIGGLMGLALTYLARSIRFETQLLTLCLASILVCGGIARSLHLSQILASMSLGVVFTNTARAEGKLAFTTVTRFTPPIYVLFFVLVGARLQIGLLPKMGLIGLIYVFARTAGKMGGATLGGRISHAPSAVTRYLGLCLFSQAGVAIGLAIAVYQEFTHLGALGIQLGVLVINVITATTFIVQIIGPPSVKYAIIKAGEAGRADE